MPPDEARHSIELLNVEVVDFDEELAASAALLRGATKKLGLSLGDRCCLALGLARKASVVTAERNWSKLKIGLEFIVIR